VTSRLRPHAPATPRTIGVDTGGTFTDLVLLEADGPKFEKLSSTPLEPARAVLEGVARLIGPSLAGLADAHVVHGTTVALNALLTGQIARTAFVTNAGFRDLIEIGRQDRPELYALHPRKPEPLVPRELRFEVAQRSWPDPEPGARGLVQVAEPSAPELAALARELRGARVESIAIGLLHAYAEPGIEERVAAALEPLGVPITLSARILREHREYERFSTACVNAALVPRMRSYLRELADSLCGARLSLLQSSGGTLPAALAAGEPVRVLFSGPAGGVVGAARAARQAGFERLVGLDMGGTSTDVSFQDAARRGSPVSTAVRVAGHPVAVPSLDLHTIGCGGGSLVEVDASGVLHVGPRSAGADPGPVAYGRSEQPTTTDAHVLLGHIDAGAFLGGRLTLDRESVRTAFERLGRKLGVAPEAAAQGVLDVARAAMRRAIGVMTLQRGEDPRALPLVAFGGAGGLHAAALAQSLGMRCALVPFGPGVLSALGMAQADAIRDLSESVLAPLARIGPAERRAALQRLAAEGRAQLVDEGFGAREVEIEASLELRYAGQSFEIAIGDSIALGARDPARAFHAEHERLYGYRLEEREIELVNLRVRAAVRRAAPEPASVRARALGHEARAGERPAWFDLAGKPRRIRTPVLDRARLAPGHRFEGPALVEEFSGTTLVPPRWTARVTSGGHLLLASPRDGRGVSAAPRAGRSRGAGSSGPRSQPRSRTGRA